MVEVEQRARHPESQVVLLVIPRRKAARKRATHLESFCLRRRRVQVLCSVLVLKGRRTPLPGLSRQ